MHMDIIRRPHPRGEPGTRISLSEVAKRAAEGRLDPRVRAWAIEKLVQGGNPRAPKDKAAILLDALRRERIYVPDPVDAEFIPSAACTLEGCEGLKFLGEDCDGLLVSYLAACGAIGIEGAVVGHGYSEDGQLSHVLAAVFDGGVWTLCDPSTAQPFGQVDRPVRERWIAVPGGQVMCDNVNGKPCDLHTMGSGLTTMREHGDFVGVGRPSGLIGRSSSGLIGRPSSGLIGAYAGFDQVDQVRMAEDARNAANKLDAMVVEAVRVHEELRFLREDLENRSIVDQARDPGPGVWTQADEDYFRTLISASRLAVEYGHEGASGLRPIAWDTELNTVVIGGEQSRDVRLGIDNQGTVYVVQPGQIPSAMSPPAGLVGAPLAGIWAVAVMVVALSGLGGMYFWCDKEKAAQKVILQTDEVVRARELEREHGPDEGARRAAAEREQRIRVAQARAQAAAATRPSTISEVTDLIKIGTMAIVGTAAIGLGVYGGVELYRYLKGTPRRRGGAFAQVPKRG